jgi:hypothetical protein
LGGATRSDYMRRNDLEIYLQILRRKLNYTARLESCLFWSFDIISIFQKHDPHVLDVFFRDGAALLIVE